MKIFVSWSKEPSKTIAEELKHFISMTLGNVSVWMSEVDIEKGKRWSAAIADELDATKVGIICCTEGNISEPWLHFEAGALSKSVADAAVHPLCFGVPFKLLPGTLGQFQGTSFERQDMLDLLTAINDMNPAKLKTQDLVARFDRAWPALESSVAAAIMQHPVKVAPVAISANKNRAAPAAPAAIQLTDVQAQVLKWVAQYGERFGVNAVADGLRMSKVRAESLLDDLEQAQYIDRAVTAPLSIRYALTAKGRRTAVERDWVK
jgi:TIR domain